MTVNFKSPVTSSNTNQAYVSKTADDEKTGKLSLNDDSGDSDPQIQNVQKFVNQLADTSGETEDDANRKVYSSNNKIADGDNQKVAIGKLDAAVQVNEDGVTAINDSIGEPNGIAPLDQNGRVDPIYLPNGVKTLKGTYDANANLTSDGVTLADSVAATFDAAILGATGNVQLEADETGLIGNDIILNGDGVTDLNTLVSDWNTANALNTVTLLSANGADIPDNAEVMQLAGGTETGKEGYTYDVTVAGSQDLGSGTQTFDVNDQVVLNADGIWQKRDFTDAVTSVFTRTGAITAQSGDYTADQITETATRYFSILHNRNSSVDPTVSNDSSQNYEVGSTWTNSVLQTKYVCMDASVGAAVWVETGGGGEGGGIDVFYTERFEGNQASDFSDTGNGAGLTGGTLQGALADETVSPIKGTRSIKYTQAAGSLNDYFFLPETYTTEDKERGKTLGHNFYYSYDGDNTDIVFVIYDITNSEVLTLPNEYLESSTDSTRFSNGVFVPDTCNEYKIGFQVKVENIGAVLTIDEFEGSTNPFAIKELTNDTGWVDCGPTVIGGTTTDPTKPTGIEVDKMWARRQGDSIEVRIEYKQTNTTGAAAGSGDYTFDLGNCLTQLGASSFDLGKITPYSTIEGTGGWTLTNSVGTGALGTQSFDPNICNIVVYDATKVRFASMSRSNNAFANSTYGNLTLDATLAYVATMKIPVEGWTATTEHVVTPVKNSASDWENLGVMTFSGGSPTKGTTTKDVILGKRSGQDVELKFEYDQTSAGLDGSGDYIIDLPIMFGEQLKFNSNLVDFYTGSLLFTNPSWGYMKSVGDVYLVGDPASSPTSAKGVVIPYSETSFRVMWHQINASSQSWSSSFFRLGFNELSIAINLKAPIQGWTSNSQYLAAEPFNFKNNASDYVTQSGITIEATTTNPTKPTVMDTDEIIWARAGQNVKATYKYYAASTAGAAAGSGNYLYTLPNGLEFDDSVDFTTTLGTTTWQIDNSQSIGTFAINATGGGAAFTGVAVPYDSTRFRLFGFTASAGARVQNNGSFDLSSVPTISITIDAPIKGWTAMGQFLNAIPSYEKALGIETSSYTVNTTVSAVNLTSITGDLKLNSGAIEIESDGKYKITVSAQAFGNGEVIRLGHDLNGGITEGPDRQLASNTGGTRETLSQTFLINLLEGDLVKPAFYSSVSRSWDNAELLIERY